MRTIVRMVVVVAILSLGGTALAAEKTVTGKVSGWHCGDCVTKTVAAVKKLEGVQDAKGDDKAATLQVTFDDAKVDLKKLETAIASAGFKWEQSK